MSDHSPTVLILGAGTMGAGIAQVAAMGGWNALLRDANPAAVSRAIDGIRRQLDKLVERNKLDSSRRDLACSRLRDVCVGGCPPSIDLVIEAIVEDFDAKVAVLRHAVGAISPDTIIATNTSSLSVTKLGAAIGQARRTVGMHFFNPAPILALVEIIAGRESDERVVDRAAAIARGWGKRVVRASDTPGFIVNRVARPFYLESWRMAEEGVAAIDEIDRTLREAGGFRMGPFELTDMIGQDVNTASSRSVWEQLGRPARLKPSALQESLVAELGLGRKAGRGAYDYSTDPPAPMINVPIVPPAITPSLHEAVHAFAASSTAAAGELTLLRSYILSRVLVAVVNEAAWTCHDGVATAADIDTALKLAASYPRGPLEWAALIGHDRCRRLLVALNESCDDRRFEPSAYLG